MDQAVRVRHGRGQVGAAHRPARAEAPGEARRELGRTRAVHVEDGELLRAHHQRRVRDRRAGAARTELHDAVELRIGQAAAEPLGEARPVGVVADEPAALDHDRVHRVEGARILRQLVEERNDRLLARIGDVQPGEAHPLRSGKQLGQRLDTQAELVEIDELVHVTKALLVALALVHRGRARGLDARADQAAKKRLSGGFHQVDLASGWASSSEAQQRPRRGERGDRGGESAGAGADHEHVAGGLIAHRSLPRRPRYRLLTSRPALRRSRPTTAAASRGTRAGPRSP